MTQKQDGKSWKIPVYNNYHGTEEDEKVVPLEEDDHLSEIEEWQNEEEND